MFDFDENRSCDFTVKWFRHNLTSSISPRLAAPPRDVFLELPCSIALTNSSTSASDISTSPASALAGPSASVSCNGPVWVVGGPWVRGWVWVVGGSVGPWAGGAVVHTYIFCIEGKKKKSTPPNPTLNPTNYPVFVLCEIERKWHLQIHPTEQGRTAAKETAVHPTARNVDALRWRTKYIQSFAVRQAEIKKKRMFLGSTQRPSNE